jgi:L-lactate dehydrogenase complex protein LldG
MNRSRAEILGKIRLALARPRIPHHHGHASVTSDLRELFASSSSRDRLVEKFKNEFEAVDGEFTYCPNESAAMQTIREAIVSSAAKKVAVSRHSICARLQISQILQAELPDVEFPGEDEDIDSENRFARERLRDTLAQTQLSITGAEALLAETGTVVTVAGAHASRQISLLPSIHLVLATPSQIYPNMAELFIDLREKHGADLPGSALTFITGPSRTADIEKVLIKGVHGPMRLLVVFLGN